MRRLWSGWGRGSGSGPRSESGRESESGLSTGRAALALSALGVLAVLGGFLLGPVGRCVPAGYVHGPGAAVSAVDLASLTVVYDTGGATCAAGLGTLVVPVGYLLLALGLPGALVATGVGARAERGGS